MSDFDALDAMLDADDAPAWKPEQPGDLIKGTVVTIGERDGDYGRSPFVTVLVKKMVVDGTEDPAAVGTVRAIHGFGTVLSNHMRDHLDRGMDYGWLCAAQYKGKKNGNRGEYKVTSFVAKPPPGTVAGAMTARPSRLPTAVPPLPEEEPF